MSHKTEVVTSGSCASFAHLALKSEPWNIVDFQAQFGMVKSGEDILLFDTGYAPRVKKAMQKFPFSLYQLALPISLDEGKSALSAVMEMGGAAANVKIIVISHFHPDHIGGLFDFPLARIVCSRKAWLHVKDLKGWRALKNGFLPNLIPKDFESRVDFFEDLPEGKIIAKLESPKRLTWDGGEVSLVSLEGHVPGQIGMYVEGNPSTLFVADSYWNKKTLNQHILPNSIGMAVQHDQKAYLNTLDKLRSFQIRYPKCRLVATHDKIASNV